MTAKFRPATAAWLVLLSVVGTAYCQQASVGQAKLPFTISRQTTHVDGPLNADGTIDYLRAFNQAARRSAGGRNAAPAILRATGPDLVGRQAGREIAQALGMRELPPDGDYFVRLSHYLPQAGARRLAVRQTTGGPWHPRQYRQS